MTLPDFGKTKGRRLSQDPTTITIAGTQPGDAIALRGVSADEVRTNAGSFFQLG